MLDINQLSSMRGKKLYIKQHKHLASIEDADYCEYERIGTILDYYLGRNTVLEVEEHHNGDEEYDNVRFIKVNFYANPMIGDDDVIIDSKNIMAET